MKALKLKTRWEIDTFPAGKKTQRGLLIEVRGRETGQTEAPERPPLNLALVIDRSGSMSGGRLAAAREAAIGISERLGKKDRLSIVAFDDEITILFSGVKQDKTGRKATRSAIAELHSRGCTNLGGGWMAGAKCVAGVMDTQGLASGHVLLLSDGHANSGITDPGELGMHAGELASRGVTSSCVGIGDGYSPLQLDAIAEAGNGNLHHSNNPQEIIDVVLGELGEMTNVAAHATTLLLHLPASTKAQQLTRFKEIKEGSSIVLQLGGIGAGRTRRIAFLIDVGKQFEPGDSLPFKASLTWEEGKWSGGASRTKEFTLNAVEQSAFDPKDKRKKVSRIIAELWLARLGYDAMVLNERGLYREAVETFTDNDLALEELLDQLKEGERRQILEAKARVEHAVQDEWHGSAKLTAFSMAKKHMRSDEDYTGRSTDDWSENAPD